VHRALEAGSTLIVLKREFERAVRLLQQSTAGGAWGDVLQQLDFFGTYRRAHACSSARLHTSTRDCMG